MSPRRVAAALVALLAVLWASPAADESARLSGTTGPAGLLAVATGDREYAYRAPADARVTKGEAAAVARNDVEPALTRGDWTGAAVAAADGYRAAATGSGSFTWVLALAVAVILAVTVWALLRRRRAGRPAGAELHRADALLIDADNALRARLAAPAPSGEVDALQADLTEAFRLRLILDASPPAGPATIAAVLDLAVSVARRLSALTAEEMPTADETDERRLTLEAAVPAAARTLSGDAGSLRTLIATNVDQARERLAFAATALVQARSPAAAGRSEALRAAGQAVDQAEQLLTAIHRVAAGDDSTRLLVATVDDFISTRRGAVGVDARRSISEARRHLALAAEAGDPEAGDPEAGDPEAGDSAAADARRLAESAARAALADVENWSPGDVRAGARLG